MYYRILLSVLFLGAILVVLLSGVLGLSYERYIAKILAENDMRTLEQISYSSNVLDTSARIFATVLYTGRVAQPLMHDRDISLWETVKIVDAIRLQVQSSSSVHSVYIYNEDLHRFYSTANTAVQSAAEFFDSSLYPLLANELAKNTLVPLPRIVSGPSERNIDNTVNVFTYVLPATRPENGTIPTCIVVNVNAEFLMETARILTPGEANEEGILFVADSSGRIVGHPSKAMFLQAAQSFEQQLIDSGTANGFSRLRIEGREYLVSTVTSKQTGWRFFKATPYSAIMHPILRQRTLVIAIAVLFLVIGTLLSVLLSRSIYRPIRSMVKEIRWLASGEQRGALSMDELSYVSKAFSDAIKRVRELSSFRNRNVETIKCELFRELLAGTEHDEDDIRLQLCELDSSICNMSQFRLMLIRVDTSDVLDTSEGSTAGPISSAFANITSIVASRFASAETVELSGEDALVIVGAAHAISEAAMRLLHEAINTAFTHVFSFTVTAAMSSPCSNFGEFASRYREILDQVRYRLVTGPGTFFGDEESKALGKDDVAFPADKEKELLDALRSGDEKACLANFSGISDIVSQYSYENILLGFTRLASSIFAGVNTIVTTLADDEMLRFTAFMKHLGSCRYLTEMDDLFQSLLKSICSIVRNGASGKVQAHVEAAKRLAESSFADPNLSQQMIASTMGMSSAYLGRIFKEREGVSIGGYLNHIRLEKARALLSQNNTPAKAISRAVGFTNTRYFFTKFKAEYGVTPTQYRLTSIFPGSPPV